MRYNKILAVCFFFNDTATTEIYTLSLHDALPIYADRLCQRLCRQLGLGNLHGGPAKTGHLAEQPVEREDRKSTRLNSSHANISYAVFCLKKKNAILPYARSGLGYPHLLCDVTNPY